MNRFLVLLVLVTVVISVTSLPRNRLEHPLHRQKKVRPYQKSTRDVNTYRLFNNIIPTHYNIDLTFPEDLFDAGTFSGVSSISTVVSSTSNFIQFHAKNLKITAIELRNENEVLDVTWSEIDPVTDIVTILPDRQLSVGEEPVLTIFYEGILSDTDLSGFYKSNYVENGEVHFVGSTDDEAVNARKVFPSFDEPAFKASFNFSFIVSKNLNILFNTRILETEDVPDNENLKKVTFETTPVMSTYLIAFIVSEYTCTQGEDADEAPTEVCSKPDTENLRSAALTAGVEALNFMRNFTGISYASSQIGKLTQASIPNYEAGAMENWGLVIYRETYLLWDEEESSNRYLQDVVTVIAHELAHQWFGDLVTLDWWSDLFLNEGFATYFEYHTPDEAHPDWELPRQFVVEQVQDALDGDAYDDSLPLSYYVEAPEDISDRFDVISYDKGGTILRMVRSFVGLENFKAALERYLRSNEFSSGTPTKLWDAFEETDQELPAAFSEIVENWTYKNGYPLLTVTSDGDDVVISQNQFLIYGTSDTKWYVPITYSLSGESTSDTEPRAWLLPNENLTLPGVLSDSDWIVLNNEQIGYYRVDYDDNLWQKISLALSQPDFGGIGALNRAQIADDLFHFAIAGRTNFTSVLQFLSFLENDTEYYPWYSSFYVFRYFTRRTGDPDLLAAIKNHVRQLLGQLLESVPFEDEKPEDQIYTLKQSLALSLACNLGDEPCIQKSIDIFADYRENSVRPSRNLRDVIYCNALRHSNDASRDFDFLWAKYQETLVPSEQETILGTLGCINNADVLKQYLSKTISEDGEIKTQDIYTVYSAAITSSTNNLNTVFDFLTSNYKQFISHFGGTDELYYFFYSVTNLFTTQDQLDNLRDLAQDTTVDDDFRVFAAEMYANARANIQVTTTLEDDLKNFFIPEY